MLVREFHPGMGQAVAERTILRRDKDGKFEKWGDVAHRVALGNSLLGLESEREEEYNNLHKHISKVTVLMSGRHLQHGDENQPSRTMEVFTNCFEGSTPVLTLEYGPAPLRNLVGKDVTVRAADGQWRKATVKHFGNRNVYDLSFSLVNQNKARHVVTATRDHRWFLKDGTVTDCIQVGDRIKTAPAAFEEKDPEAVRHGLIFGDGSGHKRRQDTPDGLASQGREYCAIRLCGQDKKYLSLFEGYPVSYPPHAEGDPVVYVGKKRFWKQVPFATDPSYIAGFIHGWWMADGSKTYATSNGSGIEISSSNPEAVEWLLGHAAYAGYSVTMNRVHERQEGDGSFDNGKPLHTIRLRNEVEYKLISIREVGREDVYCVVEPVTTGFVLGNGLLTGNCSSSSSSFLMFYLLMSGSGVGRCYDDDMMLVNWDNAPNLRCVIDEKHPDYDYMSHESVRDAQHKYGNGRDVMWFKVPDSREGWAKAVEVYENSAFEKIHRDKTLILDFSDVRPSKTPIKGMQGRPASGPVPLMNAFIKASSLKGAGLDPWRQAMYIDHYFAECVLVGGARRSARMSVKSWRDKNILDFIQVKRPIEYLGKNVEEIVNVRKTVSPMGFLWSSNNSILVDEEFWELLNISYPNEISDPEKRELCKHAHAVFDMTTSAAYADGTGEPGFINQDKLVQNNEGLNELLKGDFVGSSKYQIEEDTHLYLRRLARRAKKKKFYTIVNPCSEIAFNVLGAFCVIADVVPYFADTLDEAEDAFRAAVRALIRVNTMDSIYSKEVKRTNRIGVAITGIHEFAWKFFGLNFYDLIDEEKSKDFWMAMSRFARAVEDEAINYCKIHNLPIPHTLRTIKPSGTVSKLWGLTEGWHLPSMAWYLRWVQFSDSDPLVQSYAEAGYPIRKLTAYKNTVIVGFPTEPVISSLMPADKLVVAGQATPEEQYKWLMMGEKYWIECVDEQENPLPHRGNQISYTLKYDPKKVDYDLFRDTIRRYQSKVRCCAMMPQEDTSAYEYTPEEAISKERFNEIMANLSKANVDLIEDIGKEHIDCPNGACPVDFNAAK